MVAEAINPPLRFALKLDPTHPYLTERVAKETIEAYGLGLCSKGSMAGRIAIPIRNEKGDLVAYAGRWPGDDWPEGEDKYKLPTGFQKHRVLFNLDQVLTAEHLVIVEGYFGVFRLYEAGIPAVALMGSSLAPEQVELLKHAGVKRITVLLDGDPPGRATTVGGGWFGEVEPFLGWLERCYPYKPVCRGRRRGTLCVVAALQGQASNKAA